MTRIAIMQPTFLPWLGYFALMDVVDRFVFLTDVQFIKRSWQRRNNIKGPNGPVMLSLPVASKPSRPMIHEARLADTPFGPKLLATLDGLLGRAPFWDCARALVADSIDQSQGQVAQLNISFITHFAKEIGITTPCVCSAQTSYEITDNKSDRLLAICRAYGATQYLSPPGSYDYLAVDNPFANTEVALQFFAYDHPVYDQPYGAFVSHMSALEALAYVGPQHLLGLIRSGLRPALSLSDQGKILS
jgi:hypothetical protein